jgi:hypothetical protein
MTAICLRFVVLLGVRVTGGAAPPQRATYAHDVEGRTPVPVLGQSLERRATHSYDRSALNAASPFVSIVSGDAFLATLSAAGELGRDGAGSRSAVLVVAANSESVLVEGAGSGTRRATCIQTSEASASAAKRSTCPIASPDALCDSRRQQQR